MKTLLKLCDDFEFVKSIIVYIDLILVYGLQEQKYNNKPYDILNKNFMIIQTMIKYVWCSIYQTKFRNINY